MLYRLIGKFVFLFFILPFLTRHTKTMALAMAEEFLDAEFQKMSPEQKRRFAKAYPSLVKSAPTSTPHQNPKHDFQVQSPSPLCGRCHFSRSANIHNV